MDKVCREIAFNNNVFKINMPKISAEDFIRL